MNIETPKGYAQGRKPAHSAVQRTEWGFSILKFREVYLWM